MNDIGKTGQPHAKEWNWTIILHHIQKSNKCMTRISKMPGGKHMGRLLNIDLDDDFF